jgi:hypothetical protein
VVLHRLARAELIAAAKYLESEAGLGGEFLDAFENWERQVGQFPESGPLIGQGMRKGVLLRFNYVIAYEVRPEVVRVLYFRHAKQSKADWTRRRS